MLRKHKLPAPKYAFLHSRGRASQARELFDLELPFPTLRRCCGAATTGKVATHPDDMALVGGESGSMAPYVIGPLGWAAVIGVPAHGLGYIKATMDRRAGFYGHILADAYMPEAAAYSAEVALGLGILGRGMPVAFFGSGGGLGALGAKAASERRPLVADTTHAGTQRVTRGPALLVDHDEERHEAGGCVALPDLRASFRAPRRSRSASASSARRSSRIFRRRGARRALGLVSFLPPPRA